jgi:hypothetical protein
VISQLALDAGKWVSPGPVLLRFVVIAEDYGNDMLSSTAI